MNSLAMAAAATTRLLITPLLTIRGEAETKEMAHELMNV